jgi:hypothetical protein
LWSEEKTFVVFAHQISDRSFLNSISANLHYVPLADLFYNPVPVSVRGGELQFPLCSPVLERNQPTDVAYLVDDRLPAKRFRLPKPPHEDAAVVASGSSLSWRWLAATLNPYHEALSSSRAIQADELICRTMEHWTFGPSGSGDVLREDTRADLVARCSPRVDLVRP